MEIYKAIPDFENYAVSNFGNVKSLRTGKILKPDVSNVNIDGNGYLRVTLSKDGKTFRFSIHRLVAQAFIDNPGNKPHINHIDNTPSNNIATNLEWCSHSENMLHCVKTGRSTNVLAGIKGTKVKQNKCEANLRVKLGTNFVSMNLGSESSVTYKCAECNSLCTSRTDSSAFKKDHVVCK